MDIGSYVYVFDHELCIVKDIKDNKLIIENVDGIYECDIDDAFSISDVLIDYIKNEKYKDFFPISSLERGQLYYEEGRPSYVILMGNTITSRVNGNEIYQTSINFNKRGIQTNCSCPVGHYCKHAASTILYVQSKINELSNKFENNNINDLDNIESIINKLPIKIKNIDDYNSYKKIIEKLKLINFNDELFVKLINIIKNVTNIYIINNLVSILYFNFNDLITKNIKEFTKSYRLEKCYRELTYIYSFNLIDELIFPKITDLSILYLYAISKNNPFLSFMISMNYNKDFIYQFLINEIDIDDNKIELIFNKLDIKSYNSGLIFNLFELSNYSLKERILDKVKLEFIDYNTFLSLDINLRIKSIKNVNDYYELGNNLISEYKNYYNYDSKLFLYNIFIKFNKLYKVCKNKLLKLISEDRENKYVYNLLSTLSFGDDFNPYFFLRYFDISYDFIFDDGFKVIFDIKFYDSLIYEFQVDKDNIKCIDYHPYKINNEFFKSIYFYYRNDTDYKNKYDIKNNEYQQLLLDKKKSEFLEDINKFFNKTNIIKLKEKANIEYNFLVNDLFNTIDLKVGINKTYVVKNIIEFLDDVNLSNDKSYGKNLSFNHNINNFNDEDKIILKYLLSLPYELLKSYKDKKYLDLNPNMVCDLFNLLKGRIITLNDKEYELRLDNIDCKISVDNNYHLNLNVNNNSRIIKLNELFIIDDENHKIDKINNNDIDENLILFVDKYKGINIENIKKEFEDKIYSNYYDVIEISDDIKNDFKLALLEINAYFDFDGEKIILNTECFKDNIKIENVLQLSDKDKVKLYKYIDYINSLGFIDEKMLNDEKMILAFFNMDFSELKKLCNVYLSDSIKNKTVSKFNALSISIKYDSGISLIFNNESIYDKEDLYQLLKAIRRKKNYVLLKDNRIIELDNNSNKFNDLVTDLDLNIKDIENVIRIDTIGLFKALVYDCNIDKDEYINNLINDIKNFKDIDIDIPNINCQLRDYQIDGLKWLSVLSKYNLGGILADDMGLGKTIEMISLFESIKLDKPILIICPKSLIFNWSSEILKFSPNTKCIKIYGSQNERHKIINNIDKDKRIIYITSYDSLRNDLELYKDITFGFLVLDEAQAIKNVNAIKSKNVKELNGIHKFALTGTPIENNVIDLWSIFDFILPKYLESLNVFMAKYLNNKEYTKIISKKIAPFILRRTKNDVLKDLPEKYEHIISCEMSKSQRMIYDAHINDAKEKIERKEVFEMLPYLTILREICVDPSLIDLNYNDESSKLLYLKEMLPEYVFNGHKILIFSSFVKGLERISKLLDELNIKYFVLTGNTPIEVRNKETDLFNKNESIKVYLISLKAGGTGLNLVGADTVIHLDPWWNVSAENQATDRAHRIGQIRNVEVIKLVSSDSIEERVIELQNIKKDIINELINNDEKSITSITMDDIKFILG